jgi:hypothetical protein
MIAFLKLIPLKDWLYGAAIATLLVGFGVYTHHERAVGEEKIKAADAKVVAAQVVHNEEVENVVKSKVAAAVAEYESLAPIPEPTRVPVLVCRVPAAPGAGPVHGGPSAPAGGDVAGADVPIGAAQADAGFNPAPAVSTDGTAADEEIQHLLEKIKLLQDYIQALVGAGVIAK